MKRLTKIHQHSTQRIYAMLFAAIFAVIGVIFISFSLAATPGTMSLTPATAQVAVGSTFTVRINEDSLTDTVNAVQADLTYDATKLEFVSADAANSQFTVQAQNDGGSGKVSIARGATTPVSGVQLVSTLTFKALAPGSTAISFANTSLLLTSSSNANILTNTYGATVTVVDNAAPSVPGTITGSGATVNSMTLNWVASTDNVRVTGYNILRNGVKVGTSATTSYTDTGLNPATGYVYTVSAYDAANNTSAAGGSVTLTTLPDTTAPSAPAGLTVGTRTMNSLVLNWSAASDNVRVASYNVYRNNIKIAGNLTTTTYTVSGLEPATSATYTVSAVDSAGNESAKSTALTGTTLADTSAPQTPADLTKSTQTSTSVSLTWTASTDNIKVTGYNIFRNGTKIGTSATTSYTDSGLSSGTTYTYTVSAFDAAGNTSGQASAVSVVLTLKTGDVNGDNAINVFDLSILASNFGKSGATRATGDLNADGVVNIYDLSILCTNWNK
jgi:chitodextrinase